MANTGGRRRSGTGSQQFLMTGKTIDLNSKTGSPPQDSVAKTTPLTAKERKELIRLLEKKG
jgi:hypothetical protein